MLIKDIYVDPGPFLAILDPQLTCMHCGPPRPQPTKHATPSLYCILDVDRVESAILPLPNHWGYSMMWWLWQTLGFLLVPNCTVSTFCVGNPTIGTSGSTLAAARTIGETSFSLQYTFVKSKNIYRCDL
jgi:hypothetical protein